MRRGWFEVSQDAELISREFKQLIDRLNIIVVLDQPWKSRRIYVADSDLFEDLPLNLKSPIPQYRLLGERQTVDGPTTFRAERI